MSDATAARVAALLLTAVVCVGAEAPSLSNPAAPDGARSLRVLDVTTAPAVPLASRARPAPIVAFRATRVVAARKRTRPPRYRIGHIVKGGQATIDACRATAYARVVPGEGGRV